MLMAAVLIAAPWGLAMAQPTTPSSNESKTMPTGTDARPGHNGNTATSANPNQPGATGRTIVPGSTSSVAGANRVQPDPNSSASSFGSSGGGGH